MRKLAYADSLEQNYGNNESRWTVRCATVVGRSSDRRPTVQQLFLSTFQLKWQNFENSRWTITWQSSELTWLSANCQTNFFDVSSKLDIFFLKSLNGHATVVGGHATVGRLSNNFISTFQQKWHNFEKSRWTVPRQWSKVTRPSADCQTTFFHFRINRKFFQKSRWTVTRQSSEVTRPSADCRTIYFDVPAKIAKFWKSCWTVTGQSTEVTRPSPDCQALLVLLLPNRLNTAPACWQQRCLTRWILQ